MYGSHGLAGYAALNFRERNVAVPSSVLSAQPRRCYTTALEKLETFGIETLVVWV